MEEKMSNLLPTDYQSFIHQSRYAKYIDGKGRESWAETVGRYVDNVVRPVLGNDSYVNQIEQSILALEVMPSMRAMMTSGAALERDNTAGYNCSYLPVDDPKSFDEAMFILLVWYRCRLQQLSVSSYRSYLKYLSCMKARL